jgi:hypothetical protein
LNQAPITGIIPVVPVEAENGIERLRRRTNRGYDTEKQRKAGFIPATRSRHWRSLLIQDAIGLYRRHSQLSLTGDFTQISAAFDSFRIEAGRQQPPQGQGMGKVEESGLAGV